ncbi:MAG: IS200/IS605 family transposase [Saprospiraceae bacterium]
MSNTYYQIYLHVIFAVKYRNAAIKPEWEKLLYSVMSKLINECECKSIIINGVEDHLHCLIALRPKISVSDLMRVVKSKSSKYINDHHFTPQKFQWQNGFATFSFSKRSLNRVYKYVENQKQHHKSQTFKEEYIEELKYQEISFEEKYLFQELV